MYGFNIKLKIPFETVAYKVEEALGKHGFGILTDIDIKAALKDNLHIELRPYRILVVCNPPLAYRAIQEEPDIGLLLPCNVVVREESDSTITVSFMDTEAVLQLVDNPKVHMLAKEVKKLLRAVSQSLTSSS